MHRYKAATSGVALVAALAASGCGSDDSSSTATSTSSAAASASGSAAPTRGPGGGMGGGMGGPGGMQTFTAVDLNTDGQNATGANTSDVVIATNAFLATLTADQKDTATFDFTDNQSRQTWSNFPASTVPREGVPLSDLDDTQKAAALAVVKAMLSEQGYAQVEAIQAADDWLMANSAGGGSSFGDTNYYLAVYGTPSMTDPFQLQFGGHHLARNYTYDGETVSITPDFTGTEPKSFEVSGETVEPLQQKSSTMFAVFDSLSDSQHTQAELSGGTVDDILMGPGVDSGKFPTSEGVLVGDLSAAQQKLVTAAIQAWVGDAAPDEAASLLSAYTAQLDQTRVAFAGSTTVDGENTYLRIDGPRVWIELINTRSMSTPNVHYHGVYRDKDDDYGSTNPSAS